MRGPGAGESLSPAVVLTREGDGFAWDDAAFGAATAAFGAALLGLFTALTLRHRRRVLAR